MLGKKRSRCPASEKHFAAALRILPGGVDSPVRAFKAVGGTPRFIVRGRGNPVSYESCSHGAGRRMSRGAARRLFSIEDHAHATAGIECRKDAGVLDETPGAYKDIDAVMAAQSDLVEVMTTLRQVVTVKG